MWCKWRKCRPACLYAARAYPRLQMPSLHAQLQDLASSRQFVRQSSCRCHPWLLAPRAARAGRQDGQWAKRQGRPGWRWLARSPSGPTKKGKPGRLRRRSAHEIEALLGKIVLLVKTHKDGMRSEDIRAKLGLESKEMPRVLKEGLAKKKLSAKGQKRATTYFAK